MYMLARLRVYAAVSVLVLSSFVAGWTSPSLSIDLAWPAIGNEGYVTNFSSGVAYGDFIPSAFPCAGIATPTSPTSRVDFPLTGARLQFNLQNTSNQYAGSQFQVSAYLGQFSNDLRADKAGWSYMTTLVYDDFATQSVCTDEVDVLTDVANTPDFDLQLSGTDSQSLEGVLVTLGLRIVFFDGDGDNQQEMYQCSYLKLVADDAQITQDRGVCNAGPSSVGSTTSTIIPTPTSTATSVSSPAFTGTVAPSSTYTPGTSPTSTVVVGTPPGGNTNNHARTIGIATGVSVGAAILILMFGFFVLRHRKNQRSKGTLALGFWTSENEDGCVDLEKKTKTQVNSSTTGSEEKEKNEPWVAGKSKDDVADVHKNGESGRPASSSNNSVHSEPLPMYQKEEAETRK